MTKQRACGSRKQDALYIKVEQSSDGLPIESFLLDPAPKWSGDVPLRSPMLVKADDKDYNHVILGVGENNYPTVPDFVEEARKMGVSKRIPRNFDFSQVTKGKSRLILMHPKTKPMFDYDIERECPRQPEEEHDCLFKLWNLAGLEVSTDKHDSRECQFDADIVEVNLPCGRSYQVKKPIYPDMGEYQQEFSQLYDPGLFISLPIHRFEYVNSDKKIPKDIKEESEPTDWDVVVCEE